MLLSSLVIQRTLGFLSFPDRERKPARTRLRKANLDERWWFAFIISYFEGLRGLRLFALSFLFFDSSGPGGVVDSPQSVMSFLSFACKLAILF